jgi:hypothetical protein
MAKKFSFWNQFLMKVMEIELRPDNMNREDGFSLIRLWKLLIHSLKKEKAIFKKKMVTCF